MALTLCVDCGNTRIKLGVFSGNKLTETYNLDYNEVDTVLDSVFSNSKIDGAIISNVQGDAGEITRRIRGEVKKLVVLDDRTGLPIMNAYSSASDAFGADRVAIAVAAQNLHADHHVLAISLGTCITYNFVQKTGAFRGGLISPGYAMRLKAMHEFTGLLPQVAISGESLLLGYDTETGMRSGAFLGIVHEINGIIESYEQQYPGARFILTGGDTSFFAGKLKKEIFADADLILKGLNLILQHNVPTLR